MTKPHILSLGRYENSDIDLMQEQYNLHYLPDSGFVGDLGDDVREQINGIAIKGHIVLDADIMDALPNLGIIANFGVGYDTIDVEYASSRGIKVTNTPDVLTDDVADLAVGMIIAKLRDILGASKWVTSGSWANSGAYRLQQKVTGKTVGIAGLGRIGRAVAERLQPFKMDIHYYARSAKETPDWTHHSNVTSLAEVSDILVICLSGGSGTQNIINKEVLTALGPNGLLVNISRGTTVDESALLDALEKRKIAGAALDVFLNEPEIDPRFFELDNVLLQPHQSSATTDTREAMGQLQRDNLAAFFADKPLITPVN